MDAKGRYAVPEGLRPLLEAFARETIRTQPNDVARFGLLFFEELQSHRRLNPQTDIIQDSWAYETFRADLQRRAKEDSEKQSDSRCESPMDKAATKIQAAFKGHLVRAHPEKFGIPKTMSRTQSNEKMEAANYKKDQKRHSMGGYQLETDSPTDRAATKIQAEIRGFLARKQVEKMKKEDNEAATKIQAHIRGYLTRKHLDEKGLLSPTRTRSRGSLQSNHSDEQNLQ